MQTYNTGLVSSVPPCVTIKSPFVRKGMGDHLIKSSSLEKSQSPVSGFCYARNRVCDVVFMLLQIRERAFVLLNAFGYSIATKVR